MRFLHFDCRYLDIPPPLLLKEILPHNIAEIQKYDKRRQKKRKGGGERGKQVTVNVRAVRIMCRINITLDVRRKCSYISNV
jgi:hypothetical protein